MWYGRTAWLAPSWWSDEALAVVDAVAFYVAECVRFAVPDASWRVAHDHVRGYQYEGQPVVVRPDTGIHEVVEPIASMLPLLGRVYRLLYSSSDSSGRKATAQDLQESFDELSARLAAPVS
jgi:hypothetical protein